METKAWNNSVFTFSPTPSTPDSVDTTNNSTDPTSRLKNEYSTDSGFYGSPLAPAETTLSNENLVASPPAAPPPSANLIQQFPGYAASQLSSIYQYNALRDKCLRCENQVYALERIGPIKGKIYHKSCFKCLICDRQLDLKTFYTNQSNLEDRQIYCRTHAPKSGKGVFGADAVYIHSLLNAPKLDLAHRVENNLKVNIDGNAKYIEHALQAQRMLHGRKDCLQTHHFPINPNFNSTQLKAREVIRGAQQVLEAKQRIEEDKLLQKFREERAKEEAKLDKEFVEEWQNHLKTIKSQYEQESENNNNNTNYNELKNKFESEEKEIARRLTIKLSRKKEDKRRELAQLEQEATADLVTKHSEEMLRLIRDKEAEIDDNISSEPKPFSPPPPQPPIRRKRDLYDDVSVFEHIDQQAINVAESEQTSYTELVDQLTIGLVTDLEKARVIFRWITVKDLNAIEFGESGLNADTPLGLLRGIKFGTETYHTLFMRLCSYAGLHCVDIKGHSKSVGYEPGMKIQPGKFTNTWNAILIDGEWRFVQCNWGARHLVMSKDKKLENVSAAVNQPNVDSLNSEASSNASKPSRDKIKYQYDEHYFLPDPEEFILEFFPYDTEWQLLEKPITLEEFEAQPFVRSLFFHYHFDFVNQRSAVVMANPRGACDIKLRMPEDLKYRLTFHYNLRLANSDENVLNGVKLERYVLHAIHDDLVSFNVHVPQVGEYFLEIFTSLFEPDLSIICQSFRLKCVCKYKVVCSQLTQRMHPLPPCSSGEWGPMKAERHFSIQALTHKTAIIESDQAELEMKFELPKRLKVYGKLSNNILSATPDNDLDKYVKHEIDNLDSVFLLKIHIQIPEEGQYGLDIYVRDPDYQLDKRTMSHCCKYLINYNKKTN